MAYDTNNPLGSKDPKDLYDNATNFDYYANGAEPMYPNRFGQLKLSIEGMNQQFTAAQSGRAAQFSAFLESSGYVYVGDYGAGLTFITRTQYMVRDGVLYRLASSTTLPYTTTGNWTIEQTKFVAFDQNDILRQDLAFTTGATLVNTSTGQTVEQRLANIVGEISPMAYGATGDGVADDTTPLNNAYTAAKAQRKALVIDRNYRVTHLDWNALDGLLVRGQGVITGTSTGSYRSVVSIKNGGDLTVDGRLVISGAYNTGYDCGIEFYSDDAGGLAKMMLTNITVVGARLGYRFGIATNPNVLLSEITIFGGFTYGCPTGWEFIGSQCVVNLIGTQIISGVEGAPTGVAAAWAALARTAIRTYAADIQQIGGSAQITDVTNGILYDIRPLTNSAVGVGNRYGSVKALGVTIETASPITSIWNPAGITPIAAASGGFTMFGCGGFHSQDLVELGSNYDDFSGDVDIRGNPKFNCSVTRTKANWNAGAGLPRIFSDESSFGRNFKSGLDSVLGGILYFGYQKILELNNLQSQAIASPGANGLVFKTIPAVSGNSRFGGYYNTASGQGRFTCPAGGLKSVVVSLSLDQQSARPGSVITVVKNDLTTPVFLGYCGTENGRYVNATLEIGDLVEGDTLQFRYTAGGATSSFSFTSSSADVLILRARR